MPVKPIDYKPGSANTLKTGTVVRVKGGNLAKIVEKTSKSGKKYKTLSWIRDPDMSDAAIKAKMAKLSKKRRGGKGKGKGRRQPKPADGSKVTPMTMSKARKNFHNFYNNKAMAEFPDDPEKATKLAAKLKAGDIAHTASAKRPLDPKKPSHRNLHASNPKKYDIAGIDTPGSPTKSADVMKELKKISKTRKDALKAANKVKSKK